jgi:thiamine monophosphate synthase
VLLIGQDPELAAKVGAHGVHLPERAAARARRLRAVRPRWIITLATHSAVAVARSAHCGIDGVFLSAIFPSRSPSAGAPLGVLRLAAIVRSARTVIARRVIAPMVNDHGARTAIVQIGIVDNVHTVTVAAARIAAAIVTIVAEWIVQTVPWVRQFPTTLPVKNLTRVSVATCVR